MLTESEFIAGADRTLEAIGNALDAPSVADADVDWTLHDGILSIDCAHGGTLPHVSSSAVHSPSSRRAAL